LKFNKNELQDHFRKSGLLMFVGRKICWINPNFLTLSGLIISFLAGYLFAIQEMFLAGMVVMISGIFDILDGVVARANDKITPFGGFLDSVADRYSDAAILFGAMWGNLLYIPNFSSVPGWFWGALALIGSLMVSYTRARGENITGGKKVASGIADRPVRIIIIILGSMLGCLNYAVLLIAILAHITALQRVVFVRKSIA
jgi:archaetidylinositol phosphate synthase